MPKATPHTGIFLTDTGCEEACAQEIESILGKKVGKPLILPNIVTIALPLPDLCTLAYRTQTARRALVQISEPVNDPEMFSLNKELLGTLLPKTSSFKAESDIIDDQMQQSQALSETIGGKIKDVTGWTVNLNKPELIIVVCKRLVGDDEKQAAKEQYFIGFDLIGQSLAKREYRIMLSRKSLKATIAASIALYTGMKTDQAILDPLADDGTLAIEATMHLANVSPRRHQQQFAFQKIPSLNTTDWRAWRKEQDSLATTDKPLIDAFVGTMHELKMVRTNAKLADVETALHSTKVEVDWVETKFDESSVDIMLTCPIVSGKAMNEKQAAKHLDELFLQAEDVLKKGRMIHCFTEKPDEVVSAATKHGFALDKERTLWMGKRPMRLLSFANRKMKMQKD